MRTFSFIKSAITSTEVENSRNISKFGLTVFREMTQINDVWQLLTCVYLWLLTGLAGKIRGYASSNSSKPKQWQIACNPFIDLGKYQIVSLGGLSGDQCSTHGKRRRSPNYSDKETRTLYSLALAHLEIIENKKVDAETCRRKDLVWNIVAENYNKCFGENKRTVDQLRHKYDSIKKLARRKRLKNLEELKEGKVAPNVTELEDYEKELLGLLENQVVNTSQSLSFIVLSESEDDSESKIETTDDIKTEYNTNIDSPEHPVEEGSVIHGSEELTDEHFVITDEDAIWDLPSDPSNRPQLNLMKKQLEMLERQEQRQIAEHRRKMQTDRIKRRFFLNQEKRAKILHEKEMSLLNLEIATRRKISHL
uniref:Regulatory protein zeste n=2 Tax=Dendroctonus ponderosae TaxID=77166 RepID=A0AAR5PZQ9_DENPD